jgi:hypothetical protein
MSTTQTLAGLMALVKAAADTVAAFQGDASAASTDNKIADAVEVLTAGAQLAESFSRGNEITEEDVRDALVGMDEALADFDAEIQKQGGSQP